MAILEHFLFNSDYPTDKILWMNKGEITITSGDNGQLINTGMPVQLMVEGDWNFVGSDEVYPIDANFIIGGIVPNGSSFMVNGACHLYMYFSTLSSESVGKKIEYRIWGIARDEDAKNIDINGNTSQAAPKLTLSTDSNYPRFVGDGMLGIGQTFTHNLGYVPQVKIWGFTSNVGPIPGITPATYVDAYNFNSMRGYFGNIANTPPVASLVITDKYIRSIVPSGYSDFNSYYYRMYIA